MNTITSTLHHLTIVAHGLDITRGIIGEFFGYLARLHPWTVFLHH